MSDNPPYVDWLITHGLYNEHRDNVIDKVMVETLNSELHLNFHPAKITDVIAVNWMANNMDKLATAKYPAFVMAILKDETQYVNDVAEGIKANDGIQRPSVEKMQQMIGILVHAQEVANEEKAREEAAIAERAAARASAASVSAASAPAPTKQEAADRLFRLIGDLYSNEKITQEVHDQANKDITMLLSQNGGFRRRTKYTNKHHKKSMKSMKSRKTKSRRH